MIDFAEPRYLLLLLIVAAMAAIGLLYARWRALARRRFAGGQAARWRATATWPKTALLLAAATLVVLAAARPQWGSREFRRERQGVDLVIALDISESMQARDVSPSRIALAQEELARFVQGVRGNRVGLVLFSGSSILRSPLTTDVQAMAQLIRRADKEAALTRAGSDIGGALDQAAKLLEASESPGKAILVVSDGEDFGSTAIDRAAALDAKHIAVFAAGAGTANGTTLIEPVGNTGRTRTKVDAQGQPVITRADEAKLSAVAAAGGGRYVSLNGPSGALLGLRDDLNRLEQTPLGEETQRVAVERFQWFLGAALALLALDWFLPLRLRLPSFPLLRRIRPRPGFALVLVAVLFAGACGKADTVRDKNGDANALFKAGNYDEALDAYQRLIAARPDIPELSYNAGNSLNRLGRYERAVEETRRALPPSSSKLGAAAYYALGNHFLALDQLQDAFEAYRSALLLAPADADAKYNLELTLARLQQRNQPPPNVAPAPGEAPAQPASGAADQPGDQPPQPSGGNQQPPQGNDQPPSGTPADVRRELQEALAGIDQGLTVEDAIRILDLLRQQQQRQRPAANQPGQPGAPDY